MSRLKIVLCFICGILFSSVLYAQIPKDVRPIDITPRVELARDEDAQPEEDNIFEVDSYVKYLPKSDAKHDRGGNIEIIEAETESILKVKAFGKLPIDIGINTEYISIKNKLNAFELPNHLTGMSFDLDTKLPLFNFKDFYLGIGVSPSWFTDDWSFESSAFRMPSRYYAIYKPSDKLTVIGGMAIFPDFQSTVYPIFGVIYKYNDKLHFNLMPPRPNITYALTDKIKLFGELGARNSEFEVRRGTQDNVVLRFKEVNFGGGIKYKINKYFEVSLAGGGVFNRYFYYRDGGGKASIENGGYTEFRLIGRI